MIKRLWNYGVKVESLREVTEFYTRYMGAEVRIQSEVLGCQYVLLRLGEMRLILFDKAPYEDDLGLNLPLGFLHVVYETDDFESEIAKLRESGVKFIMEPMVIEAEFGKRKFAFFEGPDGIRTEVMQILEDTGRA